LLAAARASLSAWADDVEEGRDGLTLVAHGKHIEVAFIEADLRAGVAPLLTPCPDIVTAAALFDLVSPEWLIRFTADLAAAGLPLYTVLTYDGSERWSPALPDDEAIIQAFHAHQTTDKGFGPAAGPSSGRFHGAKPACLGLRRPHRPESLATDRRRSRIDRRTGQGNGGRRRADRASTGHLWPRPGPSGGKAPAPAPSATPTFSPGRPSAEPGPKHHPARWSPAGGKR
jgi:hypothetical protein